MTAQPSHMLGTFLCIAALAAVLEGCTASPPPEERTDDGLVRVPSRPQGGVYRSPDADFTRYRRIMIEPLTVEFAPGWRKQHQDVTDKEVRRIQSEALEMFREEFIEVLVDEGPYELAESRDSDVLHVVPRVVDLDIPAPDMGAAAKRSYAPHPVRLQITGELRDAVSGTLLLRVVMFDGQQRYPANELRPANRGTNARDMKGSFWKWSQLVREALDVAKVARPGSPHRGSH
jgi:hypothetical protein